jgi:hypothetical protein
MELNLVTIVEQPDHTILSVFSIFIGQSVLAVVCGVYRAPQAGKDQKYISSIFRKRIEQLHRTRRHFVSRAAKGLVCIWNTTIGT